MDTAAKTALSPRRLEGKYFKKKKKKKVAVVWCILIVADIR